MNKYTSIFGFNFRISAVDLKINRCVPEFYS